MHTKNIELSTKLTLTNCNVLGTLMFPYSFSGPHTCSLPSLCSKQHNSTPRNTFSACSTLLRCSETSSDCCVSCSMPFLHSSRHVSWSAMASLFWQCRNRASATRTGKSKERLPWTPRLPGLHYRLQAWPACG